VVGQMRSRVQHGLDVAAALGCGQRLPDQGRVPGVRTWGEDWLMAALARSGRRSRSDPIVVTRPGCC
jgi:hypothetical protein